MFKLENDRLCLSLLEPGEGTNSMERFDRSAYIYSAVLDGKYEFLSSEPGDLLPHRLTGGFGLVSEIKCDDLGKEAGPDAWFPKFGVGLLKNSAEGGRFTFREPYPTDPFRVEWSSNGTKAEFHTLPKECMGYALDEKRTVTLEGSTVTIAYSYANVGSKALSLGEYVHNFQTIEHRRLDSGYRLDGSFTDHTGLVQDSAPVVRGEGSSFIWTGYADKSNMLKLFAEDIDSSKPFMWKLTNSGSPAWVMEEDSFAPARMPCWSIDHIISPEVYNEFTLQPGETVSYTRKWTFGD